MGREIRKVPKDWSHPIDEINPKYKNHKGELKTKYIPLYDESFSTASAEWKEGFKEWKPEDHEGFEYWEVEGSPPERERYVPYEPGECSWFQVYETVSEGTPLTPPLETKEELVKYLCTHGTFWDKNPWPKESAEKFVSSGYFPSMMVFNNCGEIKITTAENM